MRINKYLDPGANGRETSYSIKRMKRACMNFCIGSARRSSKGLAVLLLSIAAVSAAEEAPAPTPLSDRVLVVFNRNEGSSKDVARYYAKMRGIPEKNMCSISPLDAGTLGWKEYMTQVKAPIQKCLTAVGKDKVLYIVFSYNTPFRVEGPDKRAYNLDTAIDQHIADIWDQYAPDFPLGRPKQPYYDEARSKANQYLPFESLADYRAQ